MTDWLYPVNPRAASWGYHWSNGTPVSPRDLLSGRAAAAEGGRNKGFGPRQSWYLSRRLSGFHAGDVVWVRQSQPVGAIVGVGKVVSEPDRAPGGPGLWFDIDFDSAACRRLAMTPLTIALTTRLQSARHPDDNEMTQLKAQFPDGLTDKSSTEAKVRRAQLVTQRQGQGAFRDALLAAYDARCAVTGCDVPATLQAAHIQPFDGRATNVVENGLLLRADIHNLFDLGVLWIDEGFRVRVSPELHGTRYGRYDGKKLRLPASATSRPGARRLARHRLDIANQVA